MITVLTPTYNRAATLPRLYESLKGQESYDFEWIVVDDGSIDHTRELVSSWIHDKAGFPIKYLRKENGGKHRALNYAMPYVKTAYTFIVDSDDYITSDAIKKISGWIKTIEGKDEFGGVSGTRGGY